MQLILDLISHNRYVTKGQQILLTIFRNLSRIFVVAQIGCLSSILITLLYMAFNDWQYHDQSQDYYCEKGLVFMATAIVAIVGLGFSVLVFGYFVIKRGKNQN